MIDEQRGSNESIDPVVFREGIIGNVMGSVVLVGALAGEVAGAVKDRAARVGRNIVEIVTKH